MKPQVTYPRPNWMAVRFEPRLEMDLMQAHVAIEKIPGVCVVEYEDTMEIMVPRNMWEHEAWVALLSALRDWNESVQVPAGTLRGAGVSNLAWRPEGLYKHQEEAVLFLQAGGGLLADDMGLGKTRSAIVAAENITQRIGKRRPRIIVAPSYTRAVWRSELLAVGAIDDPNDFTYAVGQDTNNGSLDRTKPWWFIHYEIAKFWKGIMITGPRGRPVVAIVDEIHWIKNGRAQRSRAVAAVAGTASVCIGLTGTPVANRPSELWFPLTVIDGKGSWGTALEFRRRYAGAYHDGYGWKDREPIRTEELQERLQTRYLRRETADVALDLPELRRQRIDVVLNAKVSEAHTKALDGYKKEELLRALLSGRAGKDSIKLIGRLRKITSRAKLKTTVAHVASLLEQGQSVVVFTWERAMARKIRAGVRRTIDTVPGWAITGEDPQDVRDEIVEAFQWPEASPKFLVATLGVLREGVTLTAARAVVLHDLDWVPSNILQAEKRIHRIGQKNACMSYWVVAQDSIDVMLATAIATKAEHIEATVGIDAAQTAVDELDLSDVVQATTVEAELDRVLGRWVR